MFSVYLYTLLLFFPLDYCYLMFTKQLLIIFPCTMFIRSKTYEKLHTYNVVIIHSSFFPLSVWEEKNRVKNILVVAYQRSGSTFTSEILQHGDQRSFFSMEPLWQTYRTCNIRSEGICCLNNKCRSVECAWFKDEKGFIRFVGTLHRRSSLGKHWCALVYSSDKI